MDPTYMSFTVRQVSCTRKQLSCTNLQLSCIKLQFSCTKLNLIANYKKLANKLDKTTCQKTFTISCRCDRTFTQINSYLECFNQRNLKTQQHVIFKFSKWRPNSLNTNICICYIESWFYKNLEKFSYRKSTFYIESRHSITKFGTLPVSGGGANLIGSMNEPIKMSEPIKMF